MIKCQREHVGCFRAICQKQCHYEFNTVFQKSCIIACAKPKEVNPIKLSFSKTNKCFGSTQIYNSQWSIKINWIRASIIQVFFFFQLKISISAIAFYWRNVCLLTMVIAKSVCPRSRSFSWSCSSYMIFLFQMINSLHWLP